MGFATYGTYTMAATDTGNADVVILAAIGITETTGMSFGNILTSGAGSVTLDTADVVTDDGANNAPTGGTVTSAVFAITGSDVGYAITMPANITVNNGGNFMTIDTYTYLAEDAATDGTGTIAGGNGTMTIGGTLNVGAGQVAGAYSGTYIITALYE